ncbi:hypothetical protein [Mycobacterium sp. C31M]
MARIPAKPRVGELGHLTLLCDACGDAIVERKTKRGGIDGGGYLTVENSRWRMYHDGCKSVTQVPSSPDFHIAGTSYGMPVVIRVGRVSTYPSLITTLADLASNMTGFDKSSWPALLKKIAFDTEWMNDMAGGQKTAREILDENRAIYESAGIIGDSGRMLKAGTA